MIWLKPWKIASPPKSAAIPPGANEGKNFVALFRRLGAEVHQRAHAPEAVEPVEHILGQKWRKLFDDGAGGGEVARRPLDRRARRRCRLEAASRFEQQPDAQARELRRRDAPVQALRRQAHEIARVILGERRHHQRRVGDTARDRSGDATEIRRIDRDAAAARFQPEDPHQPAGNRTEPPMSVPRCSGPQHAAAAAAAPAEEPPGLHVKFQGLRVSG